MKTYSLFKCTVVLLLLAFCAAGCTAIRNQDPALQLGINIGVMKAIEAAKPEYRLARASRIVDLADTALHMLDEDDVVVSLVYSRILQEIKWHELEPSDEYLLRYLLAETAEAVQDRIDSGTVDGAELTTVRTAVRWVKQSAETYRSMLAGRSS